MCGIFASNDPIIKTYHEKTISNHLDFRGPDYQSGLISFKGWKLYHSRLSIIGIDKKYNQPFVCDDGSYLLFNGEIFNYKLISKKYLKFKNPKSDTEILSKLITKQDFDYNYLNGFFSIVRISKGGDLLNCARDNFGVKPLYYIKRKNYISICSEPAVLKKIFHLKINNEAIKEYKYFRYPIFSETYYKRMKTVKPGECLIKGHFFTIEKYFQKKKENKINLKKLLQKTIINRLMSDVKVGLLISSGIDSNIIRNFGNLSNLFSGGNLNDEDYIFLKKKKVNFNFVNVNKKIFVKTLTKMIKVRQEPLSVPNEVILYLIAKKARRKGIKVLLSGEGADELFGGYDRIYNWFKDNKFKFDDFLRLYCYSKPRKGSKVYVKLKNELGKISIKDGFNKLRYFFIKYHLPILLRRLDFSLMLAGVEGREPFLSKNIFYEALKYKPSELMSQEYKIGKMPLRNLVKDIFDKKFYLQKKIGFPVNLKKIFSEKKYKYDTQYDIWFKENLKILKQQ